jgi:Lrp/AsnC family leucine-responsive transcriptional regulator
MDENYNFINLDTIDKKIISLLKTNARNSVSKIADLIKLSVPATSGRIKKLEDLDIIKGYKAIVNSRKIGLDLSALITIISESSSNYEKIIEFVKQVDEIVECFATTGRGSHILMIETRNTASLEKLLRTIQSWPNVIRTETQIILSENKNFNTPLVKK